MKQKIKLVWTSLSYAHAQDGWSSHFVCLSVCVSVTAIFARELITAVQVYSINGFSMIWFLAGGFR